MGSEVEYLPPKHVDSLVPTTPIRVRSLNTRQRYGKIEMMVDLNGEIHWIRSWRKIEEGSNAGR